jgi:hypothetical protein
MSLARAHERRQKRLKLRIFGMFVVVVGAMIIVTWYQRRERALENEALRAAQPAVPASPLPTPSVATGTTAGSAERVRKIDKQAREAILDRIRTARAARSNSGAPAEHAAPALPTLSGTISKDDIRAGVRAVIPLLAECYSAAQDRLPIKTGKIVVQMHLTGEPEAGTLIEKAEIEGDAHFTKDAELVECLQQTMLSVELPPIAEGGTIDVTYPIEFAPG